MLLSRVFRKVQAQGILGFVPNIRDRFFAKKVALEVIYAERKISSSLSNSFLLSVTIPIAEAPAQAAGIDTSWVENFLKK